MIFQLFGWKPSHVSLWMSLFRGDSILPGKYSADYFLGSKDWTARILGLVKERGLGGGLSIQHTDLQFSFWFWFSPSFVSAVLTSEVSRLFSLSMYCSFPAGIGRVFLCERRVGPEIQLLFTQISK